MKTPTATILLVDDDELILETFSKMLSGYYQVLTASGGSDGLDLLQHHEIDLILSDQCMPGMTGDEFLSHAAQAFPDIERILITGYASLEAVIRGVNHGRINYYLEKPIELSTLRPLLERGIAQTRERRLQRGASQLMETLRPGRPVAPEPRPFLLWGAQGEDCLVIEGVINS